VARDGFGGDWCVLMPSTIAPYLYTQKKVIRKARQTCHTTRVQWEDIQVLRSRAR
jgi:hypothetical protein